MWAWTWAEPRQERGNVGTGVGVRFGEGVVDAVWFACREARRAAAAAPRPCGVVFLWPVPADVRDAPPGLG